MPSIFGLRPNKNCAYKYTELGTVNIALWGIRYTICKMTGKRAENLIEIRTHIKARSLLCLERADIHHEVCDIRGEGQMSHRSVCMWVAKFKAGQQDLKDAARSGRPPTTTTKVTLRKLPIYLKSGCSIHHKGSSMICELFFCTSS